MPKDQFEGRFKFEIERVLSSYGIDLPVRVEAANDYASYSVRVIVFFGAPTKMNVNWKVDPDCISLGFIDEAIAQFELEIPQDARFPIEVPEWQLQNLTSNELSNRC